MKQVFAVHQASTLCGENETEIYSKVPLTQESATPNSSKSICHEEMTYTS